MFSDFKAIEEKLYYGLGAIKNVGFEAISNIVNEREKNGKFKTFVDFINRVNAKDVNKLQLEGLVKSGVFDEFDKDRNKILNSIPKIIQKLKILMMTKKIINQISLTIMRIMKKNINLNQQYPGHKRNFYLRNLNQLDFI